MDITVFYLILRAISVLLKTAQARLLYYLGYNPIMSVSDKERQVM